MLHLYELCRLCAQKKRNKFDLFTSPSCEEAEILLAKISICLSLQVKGKFKFLVTKFVLPRLA